MAPSSFAAVNNGIIAVFLYNFSNFIEWPSSAFQRNANLEICLLGKVDFADTMRNFEGTPIRGHPLRIVATQDEQMVMGGCHILYVGIDRRADLQRFLKNLNHMFVLSVGENDNFIKDGGTINIVRTADQALFSIDLNKAVQNGLTVSSDLLELATVINEN
ncbi:MAG: YfiR family protein [Reinekea sp.]|nr:YfiR family protein [Reinekea sp.]